MSELKAFNCVESDLQEFCEPRLVYLKDDAERRLTFKNPKIRIGTGLPEWGAEPGKTYFVITWSE